MASESADEVGKGLMRSLSSTVNSVWVGGPLGPIISACLTSFLTQGYRMVLHVYDEPNDVPDGVTLADASEIFPPSKVFKNRRTGSYAPFSDIFRYRMLTMDIGMYVDCDIYCLRTFPSDRYLYAWDYWDPQKITNAILALPADCPALAELAAIGEKGSFSRPWKRQFKEKTCQLFGLRRFDRLNYNDLGPLALTWYLKKYGLDIYASPTDRFIVDDIRWQRWFDPHVDIYDLISHRTLSVHLGFTLRQRMSEFSKIPKGCIMDKVINCELQI